MSCLRIGVYDDPGRVLSLYEVRGQYVRLLLMYLNSKGETKSKVTKSAKFGGGRWQVSRNVDAQGHFNSNLL